MSEIVKPQYYNIYREPNKEMDWDAITRRFIHMMSDPEIDILIICRLGPLFALDPPETFGGYLHHGRPRYP